MAHPATLDVDWRELDKRSAHAGSLLSRFVLEHSPVVFGCRYTAEDMIVLDLIGRYRFPVRVIAWDTGVSAAQSEQFRAFLVRRYVFATPVTHVRDERLHPSAGFASAADAYDWLVVAFTGCRGWLTGARGNQARALIGSAWSGDAAHQVARAAPLADWSDEDVRAYVERWELLCKPA